MAEIETMLERLYKECKAPAWNFANQILFHVPQRVEAIIEKAVVTPTLATELPLSSRGRFPLTELGRVRRCVAHMLACKGAVAQSMLRL